MKSETYQKEGWFVLEVENQVFGQSSEASENIKNLESEDFIFNHQNKEEAKNKLDSSAQDLTDFIDSLIQDVPDPSEEDVTAGIEKILERTHPSESPTVTVKTDKKKKVTLKVLFVAALLSVLSFSCLFVMGNHHNISIENGFVSFAKDTMQVVFFGDSEEKYITVDALLTDLEAHGFGDILFPQEFVNNSDEYKVSMPVYSKNTLKEQVSFNAYNNEKVYCLTISKTIEDKEDFSYLKIDAAETLFINNIYFYLFQFDNTDLAIEFLEDNYRYVINSKSSYSDVVNIIESIQR